MLYFIVNAASRTGHGREVWQKLQKKLESEKVPYKAYLTDHKGHACELAAAITGKNAFNQPVNLIAVGGDGTMNEVINGIRNFDRVRFGIIPNGSGNDFARGLGLPKDPVKNLDMILAGCRANADSLRRIDLGSAEIPGKCRLFAISSGIGLDAIVCRQALTSGMKKVLNSIRLGSLTYILLTVKNLFTMKTAEAGIEYLSVMQKITACKKKLIFAAAMNLPAEGGGVPMAPLASCTDGRLSLALAGGIPKWRTFFLLPFLAAGKQSIIRGFQEKDACEIRISLSRPMTVHTDGEYLGETDRVCFRCLPEKLYLLQ